MSVVVVILDAVCVALHIEGRGGEVEFASVANTHHGVALHLSSRPAPVDACANVRLPDAIACVSSNGGSSRIWTGDLGAGDSWARFRYCARMRSSLTLGLLLAAALGGCSPGGAGQGSWGSTPAVMPMGENSGPTPVELSSSTAALGESSTGAAASTTGIGTSEGTSTSETITWDMGVPDFGSAQPLGCGGKIDFLFVISAEGTMKGHQTQLIAAFPGFMDAIEEQLPEFDVQVLVANPNPKPGWFMDDCSLCQDDCDPYGDLPYCGAQLTACDRKTGSALTYPAGAGASNRRCEIAGGRRYIVSHEGDMTGAFQCTAQVGINGAGIAGEVMTAALQPELNDPSDEDACNRGFVRDDALLFVTMIQDTYDDFSLGTVDEWIEALRSAKHGDDDSFAVLVLTTDIDIGYGQLCWPDDFDGTKNRLRVLAESVKHGFIGSICMEDYAPFFEDHVTALVDLCKGFVPPG